MIEREAEPNAVTAMPRGCDCAHAVLARALNAVMALESGEVGAVLALAEARRSGVGAALAIAFEAEARHLAALSRRAYAAADRITSNATSCARGT